MALPLLQSGGGGSSPVTSVFTRTGAVVAANNDYSFSQLSGSIALGQTVLTTLGDVEYVATGPVLARLAGNTTAVKQYLSQTGTGTVSAAPAWAQINYADITGTTPTPPSGSVLWSALGSATGALTLANGTNATTFNHTSNVIWLWANTTIASAITTNASPIFTLSANYWTGAASTPDSWTISSSLAAGTNAVSTLTIGHSGSTGSVLVSIPSSGSGIQATKFSGGSGGIGTGSGGANSVGLYASAQLVLEANGSNISLRNGWTLGWPSSGISASPDTGVSRLAAASVAIGNGMAADVSGTLTLATEVKQSANAAQWIQGQASELLTLSTVALTTDTVGNLLPANSIIEAVVCRVTTTITTTTNWAVGDATIAARFSAANATLTAGTTSVGITQCDQTGTSGPKQIAAAKVRITCTGSNPGAGIIRITVFYRQFVAPTS